MRAWRPADLGKAIFRYAAGIAFVVLFPLTLHAGFALPDETQHAIPEPAHVCRGQDMFAAMARTDPERHAKILAEAKTTANATAVFWKIEKPGLDPSHLFGTMHISDERVSVLSPPVSTALTQSKSVLLEIADMSGNSAAAALTSSRQLAFFLDGRTLSSLLPPEDFAIAQEALQRAGVPAMFANLLKPWIVTLVLAGSDCERDKATAGAPVLDMKIAEAAKSAGIPVSGLETVDGQLKALADLPEDQQVAMLKAAVKFADRANDLLETTVQFYLQRNLGSIWPFQYALGEQAGLSREAYAGFEQSIVVKRNLNMRNGALPSILKGGAFVAVGALHLSGDKGLVQLLRDAGYTVTPIE